MFKESILPSYTYKIYGLKIKSEIPMSELIRIDESECIDPDASISYGIVPREIEGAVIKEECFKLAKKELYLYIKDIAHYYVQNGNKILVEPVSNNNLEEIKVFILGTCLGMLLNQRNTVAIHGGAVVINGQGIIITGHTGAGKSTLTSAFRKEGLSFLADDVSALGFDLNGNCIIYPTYPQQKLCRDAMERMGYDTRKFAITDASRDKYAIPLEKNFLNIPVTLNSVYEINTGETSDVEITEIFGNEKIKTILKNIYRIEFIRYIGLEPQYFKKCVEITKNISVYRIVRPKTGFTIDEQIELIKGTLKVVGINAL